MTSPVTSAMAYVYRQNQYIRQKSRQVYNEMNGYDTSAMPPAMNRPVASAGTKAQPQASDARPSSNPRGGRISAPQSSGSSAAKPRKSSSSSRPRKSNVPRPKSASTQKRRPRPNKRIKKAIANTQADKHGRDSARMTALETSGIDGKGLRINRVR